MSLHCAIIYSLCYILPCIAISLSPLSLTPCTSSKMTGLPFKQKLELALLPTLGETPFLLKSLLPFHLPLPSHWISTSGIIASATLTWQASSKLFPVNLVTAVKLDSQADLDKVYKACKAGKMHADPFPPSTSRATRQRYLQLVHSDVNSPVRVPTHQGYRYWVTFIDDFSRFRLFISLSKSRRPLLLSSSSKLGLRTSLE